MKSASCFTWVPPPQGYLKFNTDSAILGSFGQAEIGGCLRNEPGKSLITFSKDIGVTDPTSAELQAIYEVCRMFCSSPWSNAEKFIVESDCKLIVDWISKPCLAPRSFLPLVAPCVTFFAGRTWKIQYAPRTSNSVADNLAKSGISMDVDYVEFATT
ncbi:hypothetical protein V6N12_070826 [Hibiscus sabdariffa]|uniref:RNase H type-1 domain-containing protein n=1 Tax=Hibiscus sabdariffa TaxID=183260 RepID=A0ABR2FI63_9ROSI